VTVVQTDLENLPDAADVFCEFPPEAPAVWADLGGGSAVLALLEPLPPVTATNWAGLARSAATGGGPWSGGVVGWFGYEAGAWTERQPAPRAAPPLPLAWLGRARAVARRDPGGWTVAGEPDAVETLRGHLGRAAPAPPVGDWRARVVSETDAATYQRGVAAVLGHLRDGDCYQVNLARSYRVEGVQSGLDVWRRLRSANPARRAVYLRTPVGEVVSNSPELLLGVRGRRVRSVPIKGTAPRESSPEALLRSAKERAELTMIVDLVRADLGRVARPGSVHTGPRRVGAVGHVWHALRRVECELDEGRDAVDAFAALFPAGSVTGAPRVRAMELIRELEAGPRGVYCGAVGWFGNDGSARWNVAIRTLTVREARAEVHVGAGIVIGSDPVREYDETCLKARRMLDALGVRG